MERTGGSLVAREIEYYILPESQSDSEFYGGIRVLLFAPGQTEINATILARSDGFPEV